jgi:hypothetical protein
MVAELHMLQRRRRGKSISFVQNGCNTSAATTVTGVHAATSNASVTRHGVQRADISEESADIRSVAGRI